MPTVYTRTDLINALETGILNNKPFNTLINEEQFYSHPELYSVAQEIFTNHSNKPDEALVRVYSVLTSSNVNSLPSFYQVFEKRNFNDTIYKCEKAFCENFKEFYPKHLANTGRPIKNENHSESNYLQDISLMENTVKGLSEPEKSVLLNDLNEIKKHLLHDDLPSAENEMKKMLKDCLAHDASGKLTSEIDAKQFLLTGHYNNTKKSYAVLESEFVMVEKGIETSGEELVLQLQKMVSQSHGIMPAEKQGIIEGFVRLEKINKQMRENFSEVKGIKIKALSEVDSPIDEFCRNLSNCKNLMYLDLDFSALSPSQADKIGSAIGKLPNLISLRISRVTEGEHLSNFISQLGSMTKLSTFELSGYPYSQQVLKEISNKIQKMPSKIGEDRYVFKQPLPKPHLVIKSQLEVAQRYENLTEVTKKLMENYKTIRSISVTGLDEEKDAVFQFCEHVVYCTNLDEVRLDFKKLTYSQAFIIGITLQNMPHIKVLEISGIKDRDALIEFIKYLGPFKELHTLRLTQCYCDLEVLDKLEKRLKRLSSPINLDLSENQLSNHMQYFLEFLRNVSNVTALTVQKNGFSKFQIEDIENELNSIKIKKIDLSNNTD
ncbi:MAG: hypothetical protein WC222_08905 [Parachlamydiales bacterium]|jgi:hypothetical protein